MVSEFVSLVGCGLSPAAQLAVVFLRRFQRHGQPGVGCPVTVGLVQNRSSPEPCHGCHRVFGSPNSLSCGRVLDAHLPRRPHRRPEQTRPDRRPAWSGAGILTTVVTSSHVRSYGSSLAPACLAPELPATFRCSSAAQLHAGSYYAAPGQRTLSRGAAHEGHQSAVSRVTKVSRRQFLVSRKFVLIT